MNELDRIEKLWEELEPSIQRMLLSYEADPQLREDLAQNIFLALLAAVDRLDAVTNIRAYVSRIVHNIATTHIAKEAKRKWVELDGDVIDEDKNPMNQLHSESASNQLMQAVRKLSIPYRQVLVLMLEDFSDQEIAEILGISHGNVRVRLNRAKQQLREMIEND
ncbi:MAG: sigma-70 family RNA polymerase sigma factor [Pseudomonadales bacterium]|nr:sigma-70 family RNA polymerase sigma factor [Pseudomonadales bacterium]